MERLIEADRRTETISLLEDALHSMPEGLVKERLVLSEEIRSEKLAKASLQGGQILMRV